MKCGTTEKNRSIDKQCLPIYKHLLCFVSDHMQTEQLLDFLNAASPPARQTATLNLQSADERANHHKERKDTQKPTSLPSQSFLKRTQCFRNQTSAPNVPPHV